MHNNKRRLTKKHRLRTKKKTGGWQVKKTTPTKTKKTQPKPKIIKIKKINTPVKKSNITKTKKK
tara:strand:+ start:221 stop:412 length:192 start_codon:yes stop_codon:yes gene_type:complete